ncbi:MAG: hypothetical protein EBR82_07380 [Caulobacteraceae bacterium]|nr:hypothetical protein [Caulobacteraceae bacterium]
MRYLKSMKFKGLLKNILNAFVNYGPLAVGVASAVLPGKPVVPMIGSILNAIGAARLKGGTGAEQFEAALSSLRVAFPSLIIEVEQAFGIDLPEEAIEPYVRGMIQLHYDLLKAAGKIEGSTKAAS